MYICVCVYLSVSLLKGFQGGASCQHRARHTGLFFLNGRKKMAAFQGVRGPGLPVLYQDLPAAAGCAESPSGLVTAGSSEASTPERGCVRTAPTCLIPCGLSSAHCKQTS